MRDQPPPTDAATQADPAACLPQDALQHTGFEARASRPTRDVAGTGAPVPFTGITDATGGFQTTFLTPANDSIVPRPGDADGNRHGQPRRHRDGVVPGRAPRTPTSR
jgi:hypothetical protein